MRIGFGIAGASIGSDEPDEIQLKNLECERLFLINEQDSLQDELDQVIQFFRAGDVLVVMELARLGTDFSRLLYLLAKLSELRVGLQVQRENIQPGTPLGDAFLPCCAVLAGVLHGLEEQRSAGAVAAARDSRRGRPAALSRSDHARAAKLLEEQRASVIEIARLLHVSPATIYRYFPRRRRSRKT